MPHIKIGRSIEKTAIEFGRANPANIQTLADELVRKRNYARRSETLWSWTFRILVLVLLLGLWQFFSESGLVSKVLVSSPTAIWSYLYKTVPTAYLWLNVWATLQAVLIGLFVGGVLGIALGVIFYEVDLIRRGLDPFVTFINSLPRPALAPVFLLWFGLGIGAKVAVSVSIVVFLLLLNTLAGLRSTSDDMLFLAASLNMTRWERLKFIQLPSATPSIIAGVRLGAVYSVLGVVVSELVAAYSGLGVILVQETNKFNMAGAFGVLFILGMLATALNVIISFVEHRVSGSHVQEVSG